MKLSDLFERLASPVYVNDSKTLYLVNNLIQKEFGLKTYDGSGGMCFLSQFVFSIASATGIKEQTIANVFKKQTDGSTGHSLADLLKFFGNVEIPDGNKIHKLKLSFEKYKNVDEVIAAVKSGIPVTFITSAYHPIYDQINQLDGDSDTRYDTNPYPRGTEARKLWAKRHKNPGLVTGYVKKNTPAIDKHPRHIFHALIFVGYDTQYKLLIGRESRHSYGYKGYFKLEVNELKKVFNEFACLAIIVDEVKTTEKLPVKPTKEKSK